MFHLYGDDHNPDDFSKWNNDLYVLNLLDSTKTVTASQNISPKK